MTVDKKVVLVTGASRGIGAKIADQMVEAGYFVVGTATTASGAEKITARLQTLGAGSGMALNVCHEDAIDQVLKDITSEYGPIAILVNNAGIVRDNLMLRMSDAQWDDVYQTNCHAVFRLTKKCLRSMIKQRFGRIVNISSVVGTTGNPGQVNYCAMKAAVGGFTRSLAQEVATRNVTVNAVAPGFIATEMTEALTDEQKRSYFWSNSYASHGRSC